MRRLSRPQTTARIALPLVATLSLGGFALGGCGPAQTKGPQQDATQTKSQAATVAADRDGIRTVSAPVVLPSQSSIADLADHVAPMVVNITTVHKSVAHRRGSTPFDFFFPHREGMPKRFSRPRTGAGSGFIVDGSGYVVTNAHVVENADEVKVKLRDDRSFAADVVGRDAKLDLALLKVKSAGRLPATSLGDSNDLRVGEHVVAVGNPFGLGHTVTMGIVSAKARSIGAGPYDDFIQTDASINPGNSGGPLFNLRGEVIGINTAIRAGADGIGFAIPINALKDIMQQLKNKGFVERGMLGLLFQPVTDEIATAMGLKRSGGALVSEIMPDSAAEKAGIKAGDIIVEVDGIAIRRADQLAKNVARHGPGETINLKVLRGSKQLQLSATLDRLQDDEQPARPRSSKAKPDKSAFLGLEIANHPKGGVRIMALNRPYKGLQRGDVIVEVNAKAVNTVNDMNKALKQAQSGDTLLLKVRRDGRHRYVGVPVSH